MSISPPLARVPKTDVVCSEDVRAGELRAGAEVVGGVSERFRRRPAICGGSVGGSGGGDPDMGGEGRGAHKGAAIGLGKVRLIANLELSILDRCRLKDGWKRGKCGKGEYCIRSPRVGDIKFA